MIVVVTLKDGREITVLKANAEADARKVKADVERWIKGDVVISFATHGGIEEVASADIAEVCVRPRESQGQTHRQQRHSARRSKPE